MMDSAEKRRGPGAESELRERRQTESDQQQHVAALPQHEAKCLAQNFAGRCSPSCSSDLPRTGSLTVSRKSTRHEQARESCYQKRPMPAEVLVDPAADERARRIRQTPGPVDRRTSPSSACCPGKRSEIIDAEGAVPAASPTPTPNRASVSCRAFRATPASAVIPLQITSPQVMIERRLPRSAPARHGRGENRIKNYEAEAGDESHRLVGQVIVALDRINQDRDDGAVEKIEGVDDRQHHQGVVARPAGPSQSRWPRFWCD